MIRRWPVRLRLTLWFTALLAAVLALFGAIVFLGLRERLYAGFDEQLLDQATLALATIGVQNGVPQLAPGAEGAEYFLRLVDANGHVVSPPDERFGEVPQPAFDRRIARIAAHGEMPREHSFDIAVENRLSGPEGQRGDRRCRRAADPG